MTNDLRGKLKPPAFGLILVAAINSLTSLLLIIGRIGALLRSSPLPADPAERLGYQAWGVLSPLIALLSLLAAPLIIYGAVQMYRARSYNAARAAAVLALIPITSVCCIPGIPIGIWALVVLYNPEVRTAFGSQRGIV